MNRKFYLWGVGGVVLMLIVGISLQGMWQQEKEAEQALEDLQLCRELGRAIAHLREQPPTAVVDTLDSQELSQRLATAARQAELPERALESVTPQPARRVENTPYLRKPTALTLRQVTLRQLTTFLYHLTHESMLNVQDLRLRCPPGEETGTTWNVEATVTYLIYAPPKKKG